MFVTALSDFLNIHPHLSVCRSVSLSLSLSLSSNFGAYLKGLHFGVIVIHLFDVMTFFIFIQIRKSDLYSSKNLNNLSKTFFPPVFVFKFVTLHSLSHSVPLLLLSHSCSLLLLCLSVFSLYALSLTLFLSPTVWLSLLPLHLFFISFSHVPRKF